ncbi:CapA family protein [Nosocomiicoccus sp. HMSC059G07]|uniref:CapA family protein n=1 Tax=Nosocomiicoccus sp. HMSC059G07 TaxID=1739531 RepID=UPI0008A4E9F6|nr:CapA family protein [Nosocomiicoccus sp. HMSC059G07]OFO52956.1 hypothetical protein HMPREF3029_01670 [Nosocomiicoccus sp. HMSC059G07]
MKKLTLQEKILKYIKHNKRSNLVIVLAMLVISVISIYFVNRTYTPIEVESFETEDSPTIFYTGNLYLQEYNDIFESEHFLTSLQGPLLENELSFTNIVLDKRVKNKNEQINEIQDNYFTDLTFFNKNVPYVDLVDVERNIGLSLENPSLEDVVEHNVGEKKISFLSFVDKSSKFISSEIPQINHELEPSFFLPRIKQLNSDSDLIIVSVTWGIPNEREVTTRQRELAHALSDAGVDIIIGNNSVVQEIEKYNDTVIFYSLGNLVSNDYISNYKKSIVVQHDIESNQFKITPVQYKHGTLTKNNLNFFEQKTLFQQMPTHTSYKDGEFYFEQ